jgi:hypothetical protein
MPATVGIPVYQTSIALNLAIAIIGMFIIFNGQLLSCSE